MCLQLIFEAVRSGFDGRVAVDDVSFVERECAVPRMCSFEYQLCGFTTSGQAAWYHRNGRTGATVGPTTDHTLETPTGERKSPSGKRRAMLCNDEKAERELSLPRLLHDGQHRSQRPSRR